MTTQLGQELPRAELAAAVGVHDATGDGGRAAAAGDGGSGRAGFLPYSGALGSQSLFLRVSAASCSAVRAGLLVTNGTGTLVT